MALNGCLDVNLLDNMVVLDSGPGSEESLEATSNTGTVGLPNQEASPPPDPADSDPPGILPMSCAEAERNRDGLCVAESVASASVRLTTNEPALLWATGPEHLILEVLSSPWSTEHFFGVAGLEPSTETSIDLVIEDINGNNIPMTLPLTGVLAEGVVLTEILADPLGPEPAQEFIEIANIGIETADISGWMIDDNGDTNGDLIPEGTYLQSGQVAILVSPEFDMNAAADPSPHPEALVIILDSALGSNGLKNSAAESIELYNREGRLQSSYSGEIGTPKEGVSVIRRAAELPEGVPGAYVPAPNGSSSPGVVSRLQTSP